MGTGYIESPEEPWQMFIRALDLTTGKMMWEYKQINSRRYAAGLLSTAGGLLFGADDALDARTGKALWSFNTGPQITSQPMTYAIDGKQ